jgi:hypothetical protein
LDKVRRRLIGRQEVADLGDLFGLWISIISENFQVSGSMIGGTLHYKCKIIR